MKRGLEREHTQRPNSMGGVQRIYVLGNGYRLSAINAPKAHSYAYAWEFGVVNDTGYLDYSTSLTDNVVVCRTDSEADRFIERAYAWAQS